MTFVQKKKFCTKEWFKAQQYTLILGVPGIVHFLLFEVS